MPFIRRRRIWWEGVAGASSYVVYASSVESVFAPDNFRWETTPGIVSKEVTGSTQLIIPDEIHGFLRHASWLRAYHAAADFLARKL